MYPKYLLAIQWCSAVVYRTGYVYITCYKSHLLIIEESKKKNAHGDSDLEDLITICQQSILSQTKINYLSDTIVTAIAHTTIHVGNQLLHGKAAFLPHVHDFFHKSATDLVHMRVLQGDGMKHIVTSRWRLSNLKVSLKNHVAYIDNLVVEELYFQGKDEEDLDEVIDKIFGADEESEVGIYIALHHGEDEKITDKIREDDISIIIYIIIIIIIILILLP